MTNDCKTCPVSTGTHKPAEALHQIDEPLAEALLELAAYRFTVENREARIAELESQVQRAAEIERAAILLRVKNRAAAGALLVKDFQAIVNDRGPAQAAAPAPDERAAFEAWLGIKPCGAAHDFGWAAWQARAALAATQPAAQGMDAGKLLAEKHTGMKVDYRGLLGQVQREIERSAPGHAEMLRQLQGHLQELGQRWYAGDTAVVDELLQLYCVERQARADLAAQAKQGGA